MGSWRNSIAPLTKFGGVIVVIQMTSFSAAQFSSRAST
jgi:hypothetical protein